MRGVVSATLLAVATLMPAVAPAQTAATPQSGAGHGPANICQELIAFLHQVDPAAPHSGAHAAAPAQQTAWPPRSKGQQARLLRRNLPGRTRTRGKPPSRRLSPHNPPGRARRRVRA